MDRNGKKAKAPQAGESNPQRSDHKTETRDVLGRAADVARAGAARANASDANAGRKGGRGGRRP